MANGRFSTFKRIRLKEAQKLRSRAAATHFEMILERNKLNLGEHREHLAVNCGYVQLTDPCIRLTGYERALIVSIG